MFDQPAETFNSIDLRAVLHGTVDAVVMIGPDNHITYFNPAAEALWGYTAAQVIGQNVKILIPAHMREHHDGWVNRHRQDGTDRIVGSSREVEMQRSDGSLRWVSLSLSQTRDDAGKTHYAAFIRDVTEQRNNRTVVEQILEQTLDAVVTIDGRNEVVFFNDAAERLWGYRRDEVLGRNVAMLVPPEMRSDHDGFVNRHRETDENRIVGTSRQVPVHCKDGTVKYGQLTLRQVRLGNDETRYIAFIEDTTKSRAATSETLKLMREMLGQIEQLTGQINSVAQQTNLLSVNATIEAARAGEAGRGFNVVAQEIRGLSNQVREVTQRIERVVAEGKGSLNTLIGGTDMGS